MHPYLVEGEQTKITPLVLSHADRVRRMLLDNAPNLSEPWSTAYRTCAYIKTLPKMVEYIENPTKEQEELNRELKRRVTRSRTAHQILEEGRYPTCSHTGILFRTLMIAQGVPTAFVETFHEDYLLGRDFHGHVFGRVFGKDRSALVDPEEISYHKQESDIFPRIIFREGLDSWDIGIYSYDDMHRLREENLKTLLERYETVLGQKIETSRRLREE